MIDAPIPVEGVSQGKSLSPASSIVNAFRYARGLNEGRVRVYPRLMLPLAIMILLPFLNCRAKKGVFVYPAGIDFIKCWAASSLVLHGHAADVYNNYKMSAAEKATGTGFDPGFEKFDYPPTFLAIVTPLSLVPYNWSLLIWTALGLALYLCVIGNTVGPWRDAICVALTFPAALLTIVAGQNGLITTAALGCGLLLLERSPWLAGACFGFLIYKPQFGILLPAVLIVDKRGRAFLAAVLTAAAFTALTLALFGAGAWKDFVAGIPDTTHVILEQGVIGFWKMQSVFSGMRMWGASPALSYTIQLLVSIPAACVVLWIWSRSVPFSLKACALVVGTLLVVPYLVDYDLVLAALAIAWFAAEAIRTSFLTWEKSMLAALWFLPLFARAVAAFASIPLAPILLIAMLIVIARRASVVLYSETLL